MGNLFSALIAHVAHWVLLTRALVKEPLRAVRPELASDAHREDVAIVVELASREKDGCVPWSAIPERMRAALRSLVPKATSDKTGGPDLLTELRVPPSMLLFEPLPKARLGKVHADSWVEVVTSLVGGGKTARADVASTLARNANERAGRYWSALQRLLPPPTQRQRWWRLGRPRPSHQRAAGPQTCAGSRPPAQR